MNEKAGKRGVRMKHLVNLHEVEMAVVHDIKKRNCRRHTGGCRGCALFVDRESGLDCAAMMMEVFLSDKAVKLNREGRRRWQERCRRDEDE